MVFIWLSNHVAGGSSQASQLNWKTVFSSTWLLVPVSLDELLDVVVLVLFVKENLFSYTVTVSLASKKRKTRQRAQSVVVLLFTVVCSWKKLKYFAHCALAYSPQRFLFTDFQVWQIRNHSTGAVRGADPPLLLSFFFKYSVNTFS